MDVLAPPLGRRPPPTRGGRRLLSRRDGGFPRRATRLNPADHTNSPPAPASARRAGRPAVRGAHRRQSAELCERGGAVRVPSRGSTARGVARRSRSRARGRSCARTVYGKRRFLSMAFAHGWSDKGWKDTKQDTWLPGSPKTRRSRRRERTPGLPRFLATPRLVSGPGLQRVLDEIVFADRARRD